MYILYKISYILTWLCRSDVDGYAFRCWATARLCLCCWVAGRSLETTSLPSSFLACSWQWLAWSLMVSPLLSASLFSFNPLNWCSLCLNISFFGPFRLESSPDSFPQFLKFLCSPFRDGCTHLSCTTPPLPAAACTPSAAAAAANSSFMG